MSTDPVPGIRSELRALHVAIGRPPYRELVRLADNAGDDLGISTIGDLIGKSASGLPRLASLDAFLSACKKYYGAKIHRGRTTRDLALEARFRAGSLKANFAEELALISDESKRRGLRRGPAPRYRATLREIARRTRSISSREQELGDLIRFAGSDEPYRMIVGDAWAGKTALLASLCTRLVDGEVSLSIDVVCYFLSRREADADMSGFLRSTVPQLAWLLDDPLAADTLDLVQFRFLWDRAADKARQSDRNLLLVVDGLDEDLRPPGSLSVSAMLPVSLGPNVHVLVSSRPHPDLPNDMPAGHPLRNIQAVHLAPFAGSNELKLLATQEIDQLLGEDPADLAAGVLGTLTTAGGPLAVEEIAVILYGPDPPHDVVRRIRRLVSKRAARSLQPTHGPDGSSLVRYQFAHLSLLEHAQTHPEMSDPSYVEGIHAWAERRRRLAGRGDVPDNTTFLLDTYLDMLSGRDDFRRLAALTSDPDWIVDAILVLGVDLVLVHLRQAAMKAQPDRRVEDAIAVVLGQTFNLRGRLGPQERGYVLQQLCLQAYELGCDDLAVIFRARILDQPRALWSPVWTTHVASRSLAAEVGRNSGGMSAVAVLSDGRVVTTGYNDSSVMLWDPADPGTVIARTTDADDVLLTSISSLPDGRIAIGGEGSDDISVWDFRRPEADLEVLGRYGGGVVSSIAALPDGQLMTTGGGGDFRVLVWDPQKPGAEPIVLVGETEDRVYGAAPLHDGRFAVVTSAGKITINRTDRMVIAVGTHQGAGAVRGLRNGSLLSYAGHSNQDLLIWNLADAESQPQLLGAHEIFKNGVAELSDGRLITCGYNDGRVLLWDPANRADCIELGRHDGGAAAVDILPDGRPITCGKDDGRLLVWDTHTALPPVSQDGQISALAVLPDQRVVTFRFHDDRRILIWDPRLLASGEVHIGDLTWWANAAAVLPDGRVAYGEYTTGEIAIFDLSSFPVSKVTLGHQAHGVQQLAPLDDGRLIGVGHLINEILVWDPAHPGSKPLVLHEFDSRSRLRATGLPGARIACIDTLNGSVNVWETLGHNAPSRLLGEHEATHIAALPDATVVTCGTNGDILLWDTSRANQNPRRLGTQPEGITAVVVLPDGRLITGSASRAIIWNELDPAQTTELTCSVAALAVAKTSSGAPILAIAHVGRGWTLWRETLA